MIGRGAVEGQVFHRSTVQELAPATERDDVSSPPPVARAQGDDPPRPAHVPRRGGVQLPAPPHPRRCLRLAAQGNARGAPRGLRRLARPSTRHSSNRTRSSATTSSARIAIEPSSTAPIRGSATSLAGLPPSSPRPRKAPSRGVTSAPPAGCSSVRPECCPSDPQRLETALALCYPLIAAGRSSDARAFAAELTASPEPRFHVLGQLARVVTDAYSGTFDYERAQASIDLAFSGFGAQDDDLVLAWAGGASRAIHWMRCAPRESSLPLAKPSARPCCSRRSRSPYWRSS